MLVGRTLKDMGTFNGTDIQWPKNGDASEIVRDWLSDRLRITPIELIAANVPAALPVGPVLQREWWRVHGLPLIHKWHRSIRIDRDESHVFVKHRKALGRDELDDLLAHDIWPLWTAAIDDGDFLAAQAIHDGNEDNYGEEFGTCLLLLLSNRVAQAARSRLRGQTVSVVLVESTRAP